MRSAGQTSRRPARPTAKGADKGRSVTDGPLSDQTPSSDTYPPGEAPAGDVQISADDVQVALLDALKSPEFQPAPQLRAFLKFVVKAALDNERDKIKGYTIAVEALGRTENFNPVTDPIVRVEAARLRQRLSKYYEGTGAGAPVRIVIPKGSYAPEFEPAGSGTSFETARMPRQPPQTDMAQPSPPSAKAQPVATDGSPPPVARETLTLSLTDIETATPADEKTLRTVADTILAGTRFSEDTSAPPLKRGPGPQGLSLPAALALATALSAAGFLIGYIAGSS
ncbi:hypothetical protein [Roseibium aggregatum]|uniref:Uncharacterized protein n=1 Tax=Roseibium aggregatum TaxID=187304 RepID=A0A939J219_9HYPH|nr:hypothetical protein [Roseibium aggregatum]MBN9669072.1 hypothetical protein [Roseibium aggregatum]